METRRLSVCDVTVSAVAIRYVPLCPESYYTNIWQCITCKELFIRTCKKCNNEYCREDNDASSDTMVRTHHGKGILHTDYS